MPLNPLALIQSVEFHSNYTPDISLNPNGPSDPSTTSEAIALLQKLQPQFKLNFITGVADPLIIAPWGTPGPTQWPTLALGAQIAGVAALGLGGYALVSLLLPRKK